MPRAAIIAAVFVATALNAQEQLPRRIVVFDSLSGTPISGALVIAGPARLITNSLGVVTIETANPVNIRVVRLGYRPRDIQVVMGIVPQRVAMLRLPSLLHPITTSTTSPCDQPRHRIARSVWEHVRFEIAVIQALASDRRTTYVVHGWQRPVAPSHLRVAVDSGRARSGFAAAAGAATFMERGFIEENWDGTQTFYAPDASTLYDSAFVRANCFTLVQGDKLSEIGVRFERASRRSGRVDISGTAMIDTVLRQLVRIDFEYVGLDPGTRRLDPGGRIAFGTLNERPFVHQWEVRAATPAEDTSTSRLANQENTRRRFVPFEFGGQVVSVLLGDSVLWTTALPAIEVSVQSSTGRGIPAHRLRLRDTDYSGVTDSAGTAIFRRVLRGDYAIVPLDAELDGIGLHRAPVFLSVGGDTLSRYTVTFLSTRQIVEEACASSGKSGTVIRVATAENVPVRVEWTSVHGGGASDREGVFVVCAVPGTSSDVQLWRLGGRAPGQRSMPITVDQADRPTARRVTWSESSKP